jgi:glutathione-regulated potassium-efflux system ancillary protein KefG
LEKSRVNRKLFAAVENLPGVTVRDLYELYPDFQIDVPLEQSLLAQHDIIVLQHPFYWYSAPALLKEWIDLVWEYGFAYGPGGEALRGKALLNAITTGGSADAYQPEGRNRFTLRQLLTPFDQTAHLCGMRYLAPFVVHRSIFLKEAEEIAPFQQCYRDALERLRDGKLPWEEAARAERLNDLMGAPVESAAALPGSSNTAFKNADAREGGPR